VCIKRFPVLMNVAANDSLYVGGRGGAMRTVDL
jgi:hypothetical protein